MLLLLLPLLLLPAADAAADAAGGGSMLSMQEVGCYKDNRQSRILSLGYTSLKDNSAEVRIYFRSSACLLYTSPSPRDLSTSRMPSSA